MTKIEFKKDEFDMIISSLLKYFIPMIVTKKKRKRAIKLSSSISKNISSPIYEHFFNNCEEVFGTILSESDNIKADNITNKFDVIIDSLDILLAGDNDDELELNKDLSNKIVLIPEIFIPIIIRMIKYIMIHKGGIVYTKASDIICDFIMKIYKNSYRISKNIKINNENIKIIKDINDDVNNDNDNLYIESF